MIHFIIDGALFVAILFVALRVDAVTVRMRGIGGEVSEMWQDFYGDKWIGGDMTDENDR